MQIEWWKCVFHYSLRRCTVTGRILWNDSACVHDSTNGTNGIPIPISFKVLPMVPLVIPLVPMVPLVKTDGSQCVCSRFYKVPMVTNGIPISSSRFANGTIGNTNGTIGNNHWYNQCTNGTMALPMVPMVSQ